MTKSKDGTARALAAISLATNVVLAAHLVRPATAAPAAAASVATPPSASSLVFASADGNRRVRIDANEITFEQAKPPAVVHLGFLEAAPNAPVDNEGTVGLRMSTPGPWVIQHAEVTVHAVNEPKIPMSARLGVDARMSKIGNPLSGFYGGVLVGGDIGQGTVSVVGDRPPKPHAVRNFTAY